MEVAQKPYSSCRFIHASIDARQMVYPMVPPGAANREMIGN